MSEQNENPSPEPLKQASDINYDFYWNTQVLAPLGYAVLLVEGAMDWKVYGDWGTLGEKLAPALSQKGLGHYDSDRFEAGRCGFFFYAKSEKISEAADALIQALKELNLLEHTRVLGTANSKVWHVLSPSKGEQ